MAKAKKKRLPKDFEARLETDDLPALKAIFDDHELDARGGYTKRTALAFNGCPDELSRWLVERGADLEAADDYGETPLHARCGHWQARVDVLLELGADIHARDRRGDTPLHKAARIANLELVRELLRRGADRSAANSSGLTPLGMALQNCVNWKIAATADVAELLHEPTAPKPKGLAGLAGRLFGAKDRDAPADPKLQAMVTRIGTDFEFHRAALDPELVATNAPGLQRLYALFDVAPVPSRVMHDGRAPIIANSADWRERHQELWELLVPSSGPAATVQGEAVRISGKVRREIDGNGGVNWDADFRKMVQALVGHFGSGVPLPDTQRAEATRLAAEVQADGAAERLCELAVEWVALNPQPIALGATAYGR